MIWDTWTINMLTCCIQARSVAYSFTRSIKLLNCKPKTKSLLNAKRPRCFDSVRHHCLASLISQFSQQFQLGLLNSNCDRIHRKASLSSTFTQLFQLQNAVRMHQSLIFFQQFQPQKTSFQIASESTIKPPWSQNLLSSFLFAHATPLICQSRYVVQLCNNKSLINYMCICTWVA